MIIITSSYGSRQQNLPCSEEKALEPTRLVALHWPCFETVDALNGLLANPYDPFCAMSCLQSLYGLQLSYSSIGDTVGMMAMMMYILSVLGRELSYQSCPVPAHQMCRI